MDMFSRKRITLNRELEVGWDPVTGMAAGGEVSGDRRGGMPARLRRRDKQREMGVCTYKTGYHSRHSSGDSNDMQLGREKLNR